VREEGGNRLGYVGPSELQPPFSRYAFMSADSAHRLVLRVNVPCNYLQLVEGGRTPPMWAYCTRRGAPRAGRRRFPAQYRRRQSGGARIRDLNPALKVGRRLRLPSWRCARPDKANVKNARVVPFIVPYGRIIPAAALQFTVLEVPQDDTHTSTYLVVHGAAPVSEDQILELLGLDDPRY